MHSARLARMSHGPDDKIDGRTVDEHAAHVAQQLALSTSQRHLVGAELLDAVGQPHSAMRHAQPDADLDLARGAERLLKLAGALFKAATSPTVLAGVGAPLLSGVAQEGAPMTPADFERRFGRGVILFRYPAEWTEGDVVAAMGAIRAAAPQLQPTGPDVVARALCAELRGVIDDARAAAPPAPPNPIGPEHPDYDNDALQQLHRLLDDVEDALRPVEAALAAVPQ